MEIRQQPTDDLYAKLLAMAALHCATCTLMWRPDIGMSAEADAIAAALAPGLLEEDWTREWPGTRTWGPPALRRRYALTPDIVRVLGEAPGLYAWEAPARPEDLTFYDADGQVWLGSVAHEQLGFFGPAAPPITVLRSWLPGLVVRDGGARQHHG